MLPKKISDLLESRRAFALCDSCIARQLSVPPTRVRSVTEAFGITSDFTRVTAHCAGCGDQAWTIEAIGIE